MTNSNARNKANKILEEVLELIDEEYMQQTIDEPIEKAVESFEFNDTIPVTHQTFIRIIGDFVRHIYEHGISVRQQLSTSQAHTEMMAVLEEGYQSPSGRGYYTAYLDSKNQKTNGLQFVLAKVAEIITIMTRSRHIKWIFASRIDPSDWSTKCKIAEIFLKHRKSHMSQSLRKCPTDQFADYLPELINVKISIDKTVNKVRYAEIDLDAI